MNDEIKSIKSKIVQEDFLIKYIYEHTERGVCMCGKCADNLLHTEELQPKGHTSNVEFFKVSLKNNPSSDILKKFIISHKGEFCDVDIFDGKEHNFLEIGGWIGDQGNALVLMGMGELLGLWKLITPTSMGVSPEMSQMLAQNGLVTIIASYIN